ncbi:MAG: hypothetical protein M0R73_06690 [Dehalococcoidia bacterium]|nr:hypothetical protein [Dehalococcoidia bacterium]
MRPRALIVRNPRARRAVPAARLRFAATAAAPSWDVEVVETASASDLRDRVARAPSQGVRAVLACGGDGTLNGVVEAVRRSGHAETVVGVVPAGTANVWAHEARVPLDPEGALALLERFHTAPVDVGVATVGEAERAFLLMCGVGLDAAVVARVDGMPRLKRWLAQGAFIVAGADVLRRQRPTLCVIERDTEGGPEAVRRSLVLAVAGNSRLYGGVARIASAAEMDDGLLDLVTFEARAGVRGLLDAGGHLVRGVARRRSGWHAARAPRVAYERGARFLLRPERPLPLQLDGEAFAVCDSARPLLLTVAPTRLRVLVAPGPNPLFGAPQPGAPGPTPTGG